MYPILFKIGSLTFYTHGILAVLGIVICSLVVNSLAKKEKLDRTFLFDNIVWAVLVGIIGARITYFILYRDQFSSFMEIFLLQNGGMVSYGGFIPGAITFGLLLKSQKQSILKWFDLMSIGFAGGLFLGRIGNLMAGEYAGKLSSSRFAIDGILPINLFEGIVVAVIAIILYFVYLKIRTEKYKGGLLIWLFVFLYGISRFIIDFWRDETILIWYLNLSQVTSLILALIALVYLMRRLPTRKGNTNVTV
ncbi:MAG TPA: prolipoprotein diacylglyceryl transferase [Patescibacteria group bacterium]|nr:prolipoprotein diacylglyceryl transferase [Patescibacteria group bacterium]